MGASMPFFHNLIMIHSCSYCKGFKIYSIFPPTHYQDWHGEVCLVFIWLCRVLVAALGTFSCGTWDPVPWPRMEPGPPALGGRRLSHWTTREVLKLFFSYMYSFKNYLKIKIAQKEMKWNSLSPTTQFQSLNFMPPRQWGILGEDSLCIKMHLYNSFLYIHEKILFVPLHFDFFYLMYFEGLCSSQQI